MLPNARHLRRLCTAWLFALLPLASATAAPVTPAATPPLHELDGAALASQLQAGRLTSEALVQALLARIALLDDAGPRVNAITDLNAEALSQARELDAERRAGRVRSPLHGLPLLLKANIATADGLPTHAGSLALAELQTTRDAPFVARLRAAGAIILGKTNLSEWANFRSTESVSGWSSVGSLTRNPYALDRNTCGSSSGTGAAIAAGFAPLGIGTETDGSIVCPSGVQGLVGLKPTVGLLEAEGVVPIAHSQDTAGPMTRSVHDAAALLTVMQAPRAGVAPVDYVAALAGATLRGRRIGVVRDYGGAGTSGAVDAAYVAALKLLEAGGAVLVDVKVDLPESVGEAEFAVLLYEFKADLNAWLATNGAPGDRDTLAELIAWNEANRERVMPVFGQELFKMAESKGPLTDAAYVRALREGRDAVRARLTALFRTQRLDALVAPTNGPAWKTDAVLTDRVSVSSSSLAAVSGWPSLTLPMAMSDGLPLGLSFITPAYTESRLLQLAAAFEAAAPPRQPPAFLPTTARDAALHGMR